MKNEVIAQCGIKYHHYADDTEDTQLNFSAPGHLSNVVKVFFHCLENVWVWMGKNQF